MRSLATEIDHPPSQAVSLEGVWGGGLKVQPTKPGVVILSTAPSRSWLGAPRGHSIITAGMVEQGSLQITKDAPHAITQEVLRILGGGSQEWAKARCIPPASARVWETWLSSTYQRVEAAVELLMARWPGLVTQMSRVRPVGFSGAQCVQLDVAYKRDGHRWGFAGRGKRREQEA